ncbi:hypothetical protein FPQ18DRAFT_322109 [Pyronema domesticum]|uniref:Similar to Pyroglutamyl-peptidase 1 acc. no. Q76IC5 n=1 Tax=Pyronema omphalodes (strain CBS 100304) TaxID=1076935 RepID=U4LL22_PYROM|nr:hypothetical protein FPQ18DRAFT_322109 [Pyronema domesticum]CCX32779.1 Similar to Pyroglutamyl-peptidase 1; acc. no. Q76IC5 [Pyronema omphalodes CBS 100304]
MAPTNPKQIHVLITGYGGFSRIAVNPSWGIASTFIIPQTISLPSDGLEIVITAHPDELRVSYPLIDALVPELWKDRKWDYILHIGVGLEGGYCLETQTWSEGYKLKDVDGFAPEVGEEVEMKGIHGSEQKEVAKGKGRILKTAVDVKWVVEKVVEKVKAEEDEGEILQMKVSMDPGMYLCGYIYRASLLEAEKYEGEADKKRVCFLHVPPNGKRYGIETGCEVVKKVIEGMVRAGEDLRDGDGEL